MKLLTITSFVVAALGTTAVAQQKLGPRSFFPPNYDSEAFVDFDAMREAELWDNIERSPIAGMLFGEFEKQFGFGLADVQRFRAVLVFADEPRRDPKRVFVFEGEDNVLLPAPDPAPGEVVEKVEIGGHTAVRRGRDFEGSKRFVYVSPRAGLLVFGNQDLVEPVLEGKRPGGVPSPELLSLTTGTGTLAHVAFTLNDTMRADLPPFMSENWITPDDPFTHMTVRVRQSGSEDDGLEITLEGVLRCENGSKGPELIEKHVLAGLEELQSHRQLGALKRYWKQVEVVRDGRDVRLTLNLGSPRQAAGALPQLLAPMLMPRRVEAKGQPVILEDVTNSKPKAKPASRPTEKK